MSSIDNRIVAMKFDNAAFQNGVSTTLNSLDKLKSSLKFSGASKGLDDLQQSANRFSLSPIEGGVTSVSKSFLALTTVALTALSSIVSKAIESGTQIAKSLTIDPVKAGLKEYETNLNSIQTILANTSTKGTTLKDVNAALTELNEYSDKTIYNFAQMARNIGTFTAAGVDLDVATGAIKGIANLAAVSGSSAEQASTAMYQLSQAMASGTVKLMDWNSVVNAGMGGEVFQKALQRTAEVHGIAVGDMIKNEGSFRETLKKGWLTTDILTETLSQFTGDLTEAQLKTMGYNDKQIAGILKMGVTATDAATKVKTMSQLMNTLQETAGSGWAATWQLVFGDFEEAKTLFTNVNNVLGGMLNASADARNQILGDWKKAGGRTVIIEALGNAFTALMDILKPIKDAFRDIFPPITGKQLYDLTVKLRDFTEKLKISDEASENLKRTFKGVFAIISIVRQVVGGFVGVLGNLLGSITKGSSGILDFTGNIGDFFVGINESLKKGTLLTNFFAKIEKVLAVPIQLFKIVAEFIGDLFSGFDPGTGEEVADIFGRVSDRLSPLQTLIERVTGAFEALPNIFSNIIRTMQPFIDMVGSALSSVGEALGEAFSGMDVSTILDGINTALFGGLVLLVKKFVNGGGIFGQSGVSGMFGSISGTFGQLTSTLQTMQANVKADTLLKIAGAVALLTVSIVALSLIDAAKLTKALTAISVAFAELLAAMTIMTKIGGHVGFAKVPVIASGMILLATAALIMSAAVKTLSNLSWTGLAKGLAGISGILLTLSLSIKPIAANSSGMIRAGAGILVLSAALKVLASVVGDFAAMKAGDIGKGLLGMAGALLVIAGAMYLMPSTMLLTAAGMVVLGVALKIIATAISDFASMETGSLAKGILAIGAALVVIAGAMRLMPSTMLITAASLVVLSFALQNIGKVLTQMGGMSWEAIAKGLTALAGSLVILALGLKLMSGSIAGALALVIAAGALAVLTPILMTLGNMSWGEIVKGLVALAGVFLVLGVAGLVLSPIIPLITLLGISVLALGGGLALAGLGVLAFVTALGVLVALGTAAGVVIANILATVIAAIPAALKAFGEGIIAFAKAIADGGPAFVEAMKTILMSIIQAIIDVTPKIKEMFVKLIDMLLTVLVDSTPKVAKAGLKMLLSLLGEIRDNIHEVVTVGTDIIAEFVRGIGDNLEKVVKAGAKAVVKFVNGVAEAIEENSDDLGTAGGNLASAIVKGMVSGLTAGVRSIANAARDAAKSALNAAKDFLGINSPSKEFYKIGSYIVEGWQNGINDHADSLANSTENAGAKTIDIMRETMSNLSKIASSEIQTTPIITPVLDLTKMRSDANKLNSLFGSKPLSTKLSYEQAATISSAQQLRAEMVAKTNEVSERNITFEQNNYSPVALSPVEIYRNTRNQLSLAREALTV